MTVKFSKHAIQRISERFADCAAELAAIIEVGLLHEWASPEPGSRWVLCGAIGHRRVSVVVSNERCGIVTVITAF